MLRNIKAVLADDRGQGLAEYGIILGLIAAACIAILVTLGGNIKTVLTNVSNDV
ncbi:MAG: Flp family type IVb pilin [Candidatus Eremiobacteraeota bacterium]|nr:Flp family type IVb pilin [Candidatus Eremiobacteraeota bacterium]